MTAATQANSDGTESVALLKPIRRETFDIEISGLSPLIPHRWSEKARRMMREKQSGSKARDKREAKNPEEEAEASLYRLPDGTPGMPATAFKAATVAAARLYEGVTMTSLKTSLFVGGDGPDQLVAIDGDMKMREDTPRNSGGTADLRYRYAFFPWSALLTVTFVPALIDYQSVVNLIDAGGNGGVGDWRPSAPKSHTGTYGRYEVKV